MQVAVKMSGFLWRPLTDSEEDAAFVLRVRNAAPAQEALFSTGVTREEHLRFVRAPERAEEINWIIDKNGEPQGASGIYRFDHRNRRAEVGRLVTLLPQLYPLNMLVTCHVAFDHLGLNKLAGDTLASNVVVARALERIGAVREGVLHEHVFKDGEFRDVLLFGIVARSWQEMKPALFAQFGQPQIITHLE
jgi:RimJ/RimL family protein N-acetyltransferase